MTFWIPNIGELEQVPSYSADEYQKHQTLSVLEQQFYDEQNIKNEIIRRNSNKIYPKEFLAKVNEQTREHNVSLKLIFPIALILRIYGTGNNFKLKPQEELERKLEILQIGCGESGSYISKSLRDYGANMINIDVRNYSNLYEPEDHFIQESWFNIDKLFPAKQFDVIFMEDMDPQIEEQIRGLDTSVIRAYTNLLEMTFSKINQYNGLFFNHIGDITCFSLPSYITQLPSFELSRPRISNYFETKIINGKQQIYKIG